ncbi:MAG: hypothetical protein ACREVG_02110 [Burkholderiales bacterium]
MKRLMSRNVLAEESNAHAGTPGCSQRNHGLGFRPAFLDFATMTVHLSRFFDGRPAPFHILDGLPDEVVIVRDWDGRGIAAKSTLISGFERDGYFDTRAAAARAVSAWRTGVESCGSVPKESRRP